jgi:hypothetical protein
LAFDPTPVTTFAAHFVLTVFARQVAEVVAFSELLNNRLGDILQRSSLDEKSGSIRIRQSPWFP